MVSPVLKKKTASTLKARAITSHPLVKEQQLKVKIASLRKRSAPTTKDEDEDVKPKAKVKKEEKKREKEIKRENYVNNCEGKK